MAYTKIALIFNHQKNLNIVKAFCTLIKKKNKNLIIDIHPTTSLLEGMQRTQSLINKYQVIIAAGGDGTLLSVLNGAMNHKEIKLLILPVGTSNDYAKALNIKNYHYAAEALLSNNYIATDIGECNFKGINNNPQKIYFCSSAGIGLLAQMAKFKLESRFTNLPFNELKEVIMASWYFLSYKNHFGEISINGIKFSTKFLFIEICKTRREGPAMFAPFAELNNGFFDIVICNDLSKLGRLSTTYKLLFNKNFIEIPEIDYFTSTNSYNKFNLKNPINLVVQTDEPYPLHLNGDFVGYSPCEFTLLKKAVNFFHMYI